MTDLISIENLRIFALKMDCWSKMSKICENKEGKMVLWKSGFQALEIGIIPMQTIFWWEPKRQRRRFDLKIVQKFFLELLVIKLWTAIFRKV